MKKPMSMSEKEACEILGLKPPKEGQIKEEVLKKAYRKLAVKYHPDKNPAGKETFVKIQKAYERLREGSTASQGTQPWRILLILKAQCILFRRYSDILHPFKYAGYPMLLEAVNISEDASAAAHFLNPQQSPRLQAGMCCCPTG